MLAEFGGQPGVKIVSTASGDGRSIWLEPRTDDDVINVAYDAGHGVVRTRLKNSAVVRRLSGDLVEAGLTADDAWSRAAFIELCRRRPDIDGAVLAVDDLLNIAPNRWSATVLRPDEALALVGLCLRARGDFTVRRAGSDRTYMESGDFYRAAAVAPFALALDSRLSEVLENWPDGAALEIERILGLIERIARAIRARDYLLIRTEGGDPEAGWDDALFFFDAYLVAVAGAIDIWKRLSGRAPTSMMKATAIIRSFVHEPPLSDEIRDPQRHRTMLVWGQGVIAIRRNHPKASALFKLLKSASTAVGLMDRDGSVTLSPMLFVECSLRALLKEFSAAFNSRATSPCGEANRMLPRPQDRARAAILTGLAGQGPRLHRLTL